ncbi:MAG TPA: Rrf2 family transcriptional regulator [Spirochaetota bacterium]|nr:Rrf2 family transcriptional regulator [Spirochaetota bacterium]HOF14298.1 Rrf2 family transcriptional regulator [Spirochaetota bacterium]HOM88429.1 Rrf2 family transcriptional regulator [Spirochaetota bacterium]HOR93257.1 Rrf2 family transcriptional regulator [Spirochaetota bacterium]HOT20202.1 Rrf2 family transcriptional regulator [Spirochaetota bacterium]
MRLSTRSRYGVRMMFEFALNYDKGPVYLKDVAAIQGISFKYLSKLVIPLKSAKLLKSVRGVHGGYMLAQRPEDITIRKIVQILEGDVSLVECAENPEACSRYAECVARSIWEKADKAIMDVLNSISLQDMMNEYKKNFFNSV